MKAFSLFMLLAACGGGAATTGTSNTAAPGPTTAGGVPAAYAGLFEPKTLTFPAELVVSMDGETSKTSGTVTCTIGNVADRPAGGKLAELRCTSELEMPDNPSGWYVGTAEGLWRVDTADQALAPNMRLLGATPAAARNEIKDASEPEMEAGEAIIVEENAGAWCISHSSWGGDEGGWSMCLKDGALVGGSGFFAGGSSRDVFFGEVKR